MAIKIVKIGQNDHVTRHNYTRKSCFGAHQKIFWADTTLNFEPVKSKNNTQTIFKELPKNFEKSQFGAKIRLTSRLPATTCEIVN